MCTNNVGIHSRRVGVRVWDSRGVILLPFYWDGFRKNASGGPSPSPAATARLPVRRPPQHVFHPLLGHNASSQVRSNDLYTQIPLTYLTKKKIYPCTCTKSIRSDDKIRNNENRVPFSPNISPATTPPRCPLYFFFTL